MMGDPHASDRQDRLDGIQGCASALRLRQLRARPSGSGLHTGTLRENAPTHLTSLMEALC